MSLVVGVTCVCQTCNKKFTYEASETSLRAASMRKYCSKPCRVAGRKKARRARGRGRFRITAEELRHLYIDMDLSVPDTAKKLGVSWWTVYRRLRDLGIKKTNGARRIFAPLDKTVFVLAVEPLHDAELDFTVRAVLRQLRFPVSIRTYDSTYRHPKRVSMLDRAEMSPEVMG